MGVKDITWCGGEMIVDRIGNGFFGGLGFRRFKYFSWE